MEKAKQIRLNIAFIMESGAKLLGPELQRAAHRKVVIRILTGRYMSVTEPSAIYYLMDMLGDQLDIRFYNQHLRSFHPKAYIFDYADDSKLFIGSSNISHSALTTGIEWNYALFKSTNPEAFRKFSSTYDELFNHHSEKITHSVLKQYAAHWKKPIFVKIEQQMVTAEGESVTPRGAQIEALYELKKSREEGVNKGLVVAATGVGKTYLAVFDSINFKRVLFLAHREEILKQAETSFREVRPQTVNDIIKVYHFTPFRY